MEAEPEDDAGQPGLAQPENPALGKLVNEDEETTRPAMPQGADSESALEDDDFAGRWRFNLSR